MHLVYLARQRMWVIDSKTTGCIKLIWYFSTTENNLWKANLVLNYRRKATCRILSYPSNEMSFLHTCALNIWNWKWYFLYSKAFTVTFQNLAGLWRLYTWTKLANGIRKKKSEKIIVIFFLNRKKTPTVVTVYINS